MTTIDKIRVAYGVALVLAPQSLVRRLVGHETGVGFAIVRRVLGVRHVAQGLTLDWVDSDVLRLLGAGADFLHAGTMVGAAAVGERHRSVEIVDAAIATTFGVLTAMSRTDD